MKPNLDYYTTNRDKAQAYAAQASWENISSRQRAEYIALARLYLDLSIQDAAGNTAPTEDAAKVQEAQEDAENAEWVASRKASTGGGAWFETTPGHS